jgi:hypothetical protein
MIRSNAPILNGVRRVAGLVRDRGAAGSLHHVRVVTTHRMHEALARMPAGEDRTTGKVELADLSFDGVSKSAGVHYLPTPWRVLDWVHEALPANKSKFTFVDLGAGKGRAVLSAAMQPYARVEGVEFAPQLVGIAQANIQNLPPAHRRNGRVRMFCDDAVEFPLPDGPTVLFLFNPFGPPVIDRVAAAIEHSARVNPRPIWIAYLNPVHPVFEACPSLRRVPLAPLQASRFAILSPYRLALLATEAALDQRQP